MTQGKYIILSLIGLSSAFGAGAVRVEFPGSDHIVIRETPEKSTGLDNIYIVYDCSRASKIVLSDLADANRTKVERYSNLGGGFAEEVTVTVDGNTVEVTETQGNCGFIVNDGERPYYFWVVNYISSPTHLTSIAPADTQECDNTELVVNATAPAIHYYTIAGQQRTLSRDLELHYTTLEWNDEAKVYNQVDKIQTLTSLNAVIRITPPVYCSTSFTLTGDRFQTIWHEAQTIESNVMSPNGIAAETEAVQEEVTLGEGEASNVISGGDAGLGGSAPAEISFNAYVTDAVVHNEWQMSKDPEFNNIEYRFSEQDLTYTFNEEGVYYLRYIGSDSTGKCEVVGETYTVSIGASELRIPNAFSPDGNGVNDVWKVGYRSLLSFKCWIFDKNGKKLYYFDDPAGGWDGMVGGKVVRPGVYYYVIEAQGADGKKYKKGGDINVVGRNVKYTGTGSGTETPTE